VYREQLQHREGGPGPGALACSGEDGLSFHYSTEESPPGAPHRAASEPSDPRRPAALPRQEVILDTGSSRPGAITFGFEVNEDLLAMTEEAEESEAQDSLAHCNDTSIEESNGGVGGAESSQNNNDDNVMMKNLLSLTNKSRNNVCSEEVPACDGSSGLAIDFSRIQREEVDVRKFNYDVILGFVSKGEFCAVCRLLTLHPPSSLGQSEQGAGDGQPRHILQLLGPRRGLARTPSDPPSLETAVPRDHCDPPLVTCPDDGDSLQNAKNQMLKILINRI
jgi:hypothetical protein